jgi:hypothetical protein
MHIGIGTDSVIGRKHEGPPRTIHHSGPLHLNSTCDDIDDRNVRNIDAGNNGDDSNMLE